MEEGEQLQTSMLLRKLTSLVYVWFESWSFTPDEVRGDIPWHVTRGTRHAARIQCQCAGRTAKSSEAELLPAPDERAPVMCPWERPCNPPHLLKAVQRRVALHVFSLRLNAARASMCRQEANFLAVILANHSVFSKLQEIRFAGSTHIPFRWAGWPGLHQLPQSQCALQYCLSKPQPAQTC